MNGNRTLPVTAEFNDCFIVSLNRFEQALFDYLQTHPEEQRHWQGKVAALGVVGTEGAGRLADQLGDYVRERGAHVEPFQSWLQNGGVPRSALLNLSEYLVRMWGPKPSAPKAQR